MLVKLRKYFFYGLAVFLPMALTIYLFILMVNFADSLIGKYIKPILIHELGFYIPGLGIVLCVVLITLIGFIFNNYLGRILQRWFEQIMMALPFTRQVYPAFKEIAYFLFNREKTTFQQVVIIEYPRKGLYSMGFMTNDTSRRITVQTKIEEMVNVYIPSSPSPVTGYIIMVNKKDLMYPDMTVEEAIKFIISGGVVNPI